MHTFFIFLVTPLLICITIFVLYITPYLDNNYFINIHRTLIKYINKNKLSSIIFLISAAIIFILYINHTNIQSHDPPKPPELPPKNKPNKPEVLRDEDLVSHPPNGGNNDNSNYQSISDDDILDYSNILPPQRAYTTIQGAINAYKK